MNSMSNLVTIAAILLRVVVGKDVLYDFRLETEIGLSPDCMNVVEERRALFRVNKAFPGPVIEADEGDNIIVRVNNRHEASVVSIHFHGIHQRGTPYSDGSAFITQCALGPLQSQEYQFTAYPPGTHYWHEHAAYHMVDGISGPIVIRPKNPEPFSYDDEKIIFLQDWYIETGTQQLDGLTSWPFNWIGNPNSLLINGKGIAPECQKGGSNFNNSLLCLASCQGDPLNLISTVNVTEGLTYRLRIINSGQLVLLNFAIANHTLTIVQVEGTNVNPVQVSSIDISPGQRYDVLVTANQPPGSYMMETTVRERPIENVKGMAIFQYVGATVVLPDKAPKHPLSNDTAFGIAQDLSLKTLNVANYSSANVLNSTAVRRYVLVGTQNDYKSSDGATLLKRWAMNNISNVHGSETTVFKASAAARLSGWPTSLNDTVEVPVSPPFAWNYSDPVLGPGGPGVALGTLSEAVIAIKKGEVLEFVLQNARAINGVAEFHPWHAHGYSVWVVGQGRGIFNAQTDVATYNLVNPILRDTISLQPLSWVAVRFLADNPGAWLFHCHILSHQIMGMGFVMIVEPAALGDVPDNVQYCAGDKEQTPSKAPVRPPCGLFGLNIFCPFTFCGLFGRMLGFCSD